MVFINGDLLWLFESSSGVKVQPAAERPAPPPLPDDHHLRGGFQSAVLPPGLREAPLRNQQDGSAQIFRLEDIRGGRHPHPAYPQRGSHQGIPLRTAQEEERATHCFSNETQQSRPASQQDHRHHAAVPPRGQEAQLFHEQRQERQPIRNGGGSQGRTHHVRTHAAEPSDRTQNERLPQEALSQGEEQQLPADQGGGLRGRGEGMSACSFKVTQQLIGHITHSALQCQPIKQTMLNPEPTRAEEQDLTLRGQLRDKQAKMLAFLYNVDFQVAYEKFNQKYAPFSELKKQKKSEKINSEEVRRMLNVLSQKLHEKIIREDNECDRALSKLQTLWQNRNIEPFHRYYFQKYLYSTYLQNIHTLIKNEDYLIRHEQHIYFSIFRAIWARQACINHIGRSLKQTGPEDMYEHFHTVKEREVEKNRKMEQQLYKVHGYRVKFRLDEKETNLGKTKMETLGEDLNNYRKLTVHLIDLIKQWKFYMQSLTHDLRVRRERIEYYYKQENYLFHILNDSNFIATSFLNKFYTFAVRNDPFLLKPIFSIEKKQEELGQFNMEDYHLKQIIICKPAELHHIMVCVEHLYDEVQSNIRNRKMIDPKAFNKVKNMSIEEINQVQYPKKQASSMGKLNILQSYHSEKLTPITKMQKHTPSSMVKSNVLIRKASLPKQTLTKTIYGNTFRSQNPERSNDYKIIDSEALKSLKEEVYKKVKHDLEYQTKRTLLQSKQFEELVDEQVRIGMKEIVEQEQMHLLKTPLEVTALSFFQEEISSFITSIFKILPIPYYQIQQNQQDIIKLLSEIEYCYILKIHTSTLEIAYVIASVNRLVKQYKSIQIELIAFKDPELLERIMLRIVQFVWKYENAKEVVFNLKYQSKAMEDFIKNLQKKLGDNCKIFEKKYRTHVESKFIFLKKALNENYAYNPYPQKLHFKLYAALCIEAVQLQTPPEQNTNPHIHYDYLIMQILRRYTNSQDFLILRDTFRSKDRFRHLLTQLMEVDNHKKEVQIEVTSLSAENISELNAKLQHLRKPFLDVTDLIKINNIKMLQLQDTLTPAYQLRVLSTWQGLKSHRYTIREDIQYFIDEQGTQFFKLPVQESHHLKILLFKASNYLQKCKTGLNLYLFERLEKLKGKWLKRYIDHLWIQMVRFPHNFTQRQDHFLQTYRCLDFASIGKDLIMGDILDWYTDIQIQNGFQYRPSKADLHMTRPMGIGVITSKDWMLYARILT